MRLTCPACGADLNLIALIEHDAAREAVMAALKMPPPLGKVVMQYLSLFKPAKTALSMDKLARLLNEILSMVSEAKVMHNGTAYPAPQQYFIDAILLMVGKRNELTLPLKTHGYLIKIIAGYADKQSAQQEKQSEKGRKYGAIQTVNEGAAAVVLNQAKAEKKANSQKVQRTVHETLAKITGKRQ